MNHQSPDSISFVMDGKIQSVSFEDIPPTTTLLSYLRNHPDHKGVKEGCAEGDCGACTVVMAENGPDGNLQYKPYNSCLIFLPMIHGRQVITVEEVGTPDDLHPVQEAMVDTDGSQCGYCTPGFIMTLFALYKNTAEPSREIIDDALTGNLCRCTGYRPIIEAAVQACQDPRPDRFSVSAPEVSSMLNEVISKTKDLEIRFRDQLYFRPGSIASALELRKSYPEAYLVAGATDLALLVTKQHKKLSPIIDISGISELKQIQAGRDSLTIGAGVSLETIRNLSKDQLGALCECLGVFGSAMIRNMATLGGNLATASPIGDTLPILMAYDAVVIASGPEGSRRIPLRDFVTGYRETKLRPSEIIREIDIPFPPSGKLIKWFKISKRKDLDISSVSGGFCLDLDDTGKVREIGLYYGGMAAMTKQASRAEAFLRGKSWSREHIEAAMDLVDQDFVPISDARASAKGRQLMARNLLLKFWVETHPQEVNK